MNSGPDRLFTFVLRVLQSVLMTKLQCLGCILQYFSHFHEFGLTNMGLSRVKSGIYAATVRFELAARAGPTHPGEHTATSGGAIWYPRLAHGPVNGREKIAPG